MTAAAHKLNQTKSKFSCLMCISYLFLTAIPMDEVLFSAKGHDLSMCVL